MSRSDIADVAGLVDRARELYADDPEAMDILDAYDQRMREPLRLALAGIVKAGKSTLLNALIGEQIAPTDAGECTRTITWYRYGRTPKITVHLHEGEPVRMPVRRVDGRLSLDLGKRKADEVAWIDIEWPSEHLRQTVLIDTPGIASLSTQTSQRSTDFFLPQDAPSVADAIVYLLRHVHAEDLGFLEAFRDTAAGPSQTVNALAVLSRADEIGSARIDSLLSASRIADRYRRDGELQSLALDVIPVAGLLAEGARTLRESEFAALRQIADLDRDVRERLLISVDRFCRRSDEVGVSVPDRRRLLQRFGLFGVRLSAALIRAGATTSTDLAERLVQQSGLLEVQRFISAQFRARAAALKSRGVLTGLDALVRARRRDGDAELLAGIERQIAATHELRELSLLAGLRTSTGVLPASDIPEAERIVGGSGTDALTRLGLPETADGPDMAARVEELLARWRTLGESPLATRATAEACRTVVRSIEGVASELAARGKLRPAPDVVLAGGPA